MKFHLPKAVIPFSLILSGAVNAQTPPAAGSLSQQIERPRATLPAQSIPQIQIQQSSTQTGTGADQKAIRVEALRVTGGNLYPEATLVAATGFSGPADLSLPALRTLAARITDYYRARGYFLAQAYLPAQDIKDGVVTIAVLEGQYGKVEVRNQSGLAPSVPATILSDLRSGDVVTIDTLESRMLMLSDVSGVNVKSTLAPGATVGASDLIVDVTPGKRYFGSIDADNYGNRYTGSKHLGGTFGINDLTGNGDALTLRAMTSGSGLHYLRAAYQMQLGRGKAGVAVSDMEYELGSDFSSLNAHGNASIASLYGSYPLRRSRRSNMTLLGNFDAKRFRDEVDATSTIARKRVNVAMVSLAGDDRDDYFGGGVSSYTIGLSSGRLDIAAGGALLSDQASVRTNGSYRKLSYQSSRLQSLTTSTSLYAAVSGQLASKNLDISEKMELGGFGGVRAYPSGEGSGDQGYVLNLETRTALPRFTDSLPGQMQFVGFIDTGTVHANKNPWTAGKNRRTLSGAGFGIDWLAERNFLIKATVAFKLGNEKATSAPDADQRFWLQAVKYF